MRNLFYALVPCLLLSCSTITLSSLKDYNEVRSGQDQLTNQKDPLPSWNEGKAKQAILKFVRMTTDKASPSFIPTQERIATFDQDGTTWVSHPVYTQLIFALDRLRQLAPQHPDWYTTEPYKTVLQGNDIALSRLTTHDLEKILIVTHTNVTVEEYQAIVKKWLATAKNPRWNKPYTDLVYQPMIELLQYLRQNGFRTYIVTGGGQDFVRVFAQEVYGIPPEQIIGSAIGTQYIYNDKQKGVLLKIPKLLLNDNFSGKPEDIHLMIGRKPQASFGNSTGDQQMLEYTQSGDGAHLLMLILHDDAQREYAYGPAQGLPDTQVGIFTQKLYDEAIRNHWNVVSMKKDWRRIFSFEK